MEENCWADQNSHRVVASIKKKKLLDFKLSPCFEPCLYSFGYFPGVRLWFADVSEHSISSIFKGWMWSMKMELIECSETSAYIIQTPENYPKEYRQEEEEALHHLVVCLTRFPSAPPKQVFHTVRSTAFSSKLHYLLVSLRPSSSCLLLLPRLPVTWIFSSVFPSIMCFRKSQTMSWINKIFCYNAVFSGPVFSCSFSVSSSPLHGTYHRNSRRLQSFYGMKPFCSLSCWKKAPSAKTVK